MRSNHAYYVYILKCADGSYYTGVTNNIERRLYQHQSGDNMKSYTYSRRPLQLVYLEHFQFITSAIEWEKQIKGWSRAKKEALINNDFERIKQLANSKKDKSKPAP